MLARDYATAIAALEKKGMSANEIAQGVARVLTARGHARLLPQIARLHEAGARTLARQNAVTLILAREKDAEVYRTQIEKLAAGRLYETVIDERIVGGFIFTAEGTVHDASQRRALTTLYRTITTPTVSATDK